LDVSTLHITNGDVLTDYLKELNFKGTFLTWQEMLCEGPTLHTINSEAFFTARAEFLKNTYDIEVDNDMLSQSLSKLNTPDDYTEINLWFEYDLFCHINLLGVINLLHQKQINKPLFLICSGRVKGEDDLKALGQLTANQLETHYKNRIALTDEDKALAVKLWKIYCGNDHNQFKPYITNTSNFTYMGNCLKAHLRRFPHQHNGLSLLEEHMLKIIRDETIKSKHHLLGYSLNYQGYYGFGDIQLKRIIDKLSYFYAETEQRLSLNRKGHEALLGQRNFAASIANDLTYGGVKRLDFQFNKTQNKLVKTINHVN